MIIMTTFSTMAWWVNCTVFVFFKVFLLNGPAQMISLVYLSFSTEPFSQVINDNMIFDVRRKKFKVINKRGKDICVQGQAMDHLEQCLTDKIDEILINKYNQHCAPIQLRGILKSFKNKPCLTIDERKAFHNITNLLVSDPNSWDHRCITSCLLAHFTVATKAFAGDIGKIFSFHTPILLR